jgi:hypothetical protein
MIASGCDELIRIAAWSSYYDESLRSAAEMVELRGDLGAGGGRPFD